MSPLQAARHFLGPLLQSLEMWQGLRILLTIQIIYNTTLILPVPRQQSRVQNRTDRIIIVSQPSTFGSSLDRSATIPRRARASAIIGPVRSRP
jgi:hypothetical protein